MYFSSRFLGLVCFLLLAVVWFMPHRAVAQAPQGRIYVVDSAYHDPEWGAGVLLELDLAPIAHWRGPITFKVWTEEIYQPSRPEVPRASGRRNPIEAFARLMAGVTTSIGALSGAYKTRVTEHPQEARAMTVGAKNISPNQIALDSVPKNLRMQVLIPFMTIFSTGLIQFSIDGNSQSWDKPEWHVPSFQVPAVMKDLQIDGVTQTQTRMQGVGGTSITFHYQVPTNFVSKGGLIAKATLNRGIPLNFIPYEFENAAVPKAPTGELTVFVPSALATKGQARIQVDMRLSNGMALTTDPIDLDLPIANIHQTDFMIKNLNIVWNKPSPTSVSSLQAYLAGSRLEDAEYLPSNGGTEYISKFRCFIPYHLKMVSNDTLLFAINSGRGENEHHIYYFTFVPTDLAQRRVERIIPFPSSHSDQIDYIDFQIQSTSSDGKLRYTYMKVYTRKESMN